MINNNSNILMGALSTITVRSGATLVIDAGNLSNADIKVISGGSLIISHDSHVRLRTG